MYLGGAIPNRRAAKQSAEGIISNRLDATMQILATTIGVPHPAEDEIIRPRLLEMLRSGLARKLLLVVAEAGYGKSTLVAQLARILDWPVAWYTVAESGRDPGVFLASVIAAVEAARPGTTFTAQQLVASVPDPTASWRAIADGLINDLAGPAPEAMLLAIDDVHLLDDGPAAALPGYLAAHLPRRVHLVLLSRSPLHVPEVIRLTGQGDVLLVDAHALAFTEEEVADLLRGLGGAPPDPVLVEAAHAQTEGWAVALSLLRHVLRGGESGTDVIEQFGRTRRQVYDYFATQVLERLPADLRRFLIHLSILEPIEAGPAAAVTGNPEAGRLLDDLEARGLFLTPIGSGGGRYRLHVLFRETLRTLLARDEGSEAIRHLERAVGASLAEAGRADQAMPYLLRSGDHASAAAHLEAHGNRWLDEGQTSAVVDWIRALPRQQVERSASLLMLLGRAADRRGSWPEAERTFAAAATLAAGDRAGTAMAGQAKALFRQHRYADAKGISETALRLDGLTDRTRARLLHRVACCHPWLGTPLKAVELHAEARALFERTDDLEGQMMVIHDLVLLQNNLHLMPGWTEVLLPRVAALHRRADSLSARAESAQVMAELLEERGEYTRALQFLEEAGEAARALDHLHGISLSYFYRGLALLNTGHLSEARDVLSEGLRIVEQRGVERYVRSLHLPLALIAWKEGRTDEAARALQENVDFHVRHNSLLFIPTLQMRLAVILAESGRTDEAEAALRAARERWLSWGAERRVAQCNLMLMALQLRSRMPAAGLTLESVLSSAKEHRVDWIFREYRVLLAPLLTRAIADGVGLEYAGSILAALGDPALVAPVLSHADPSARLRAIPVLERIGGEESRTLLSRATKDPASVVSLRARMALAEISKRPPPTLTVQLLGGFEVHRGGALLPPSVWQRRRDRLLFAHLLITDEPVSRDSLLEALWPDLSPSSATASLNVAWSRLKRTLEPSLPEGIPSAYLTIDGTRYALRRDAVETDVHQFTTLVARADRSDPKEQVAGLQEAVHAYWGDLLPDDANEPWTVVERERLRSLYLTGLQRLAEGKAAEGRPEDAIEDLRTILRLEPWREEVYRRLMELLAALGRRSEALHLYRQCEALLRRDLGVSPASETTALFEAIASRGSV